MKRNSRWRRLAGRGALGAACCAFALAGCLSCQSARLRPPANARPQEMVCTVTGYCNCGICCSWKRSWFGLGPAVVSAGPDAGRRKAVGITASGARAQHGTIAADTAVLPFGTIVEVPGYGYGRVEDRGGAIAGNHIDLWFPTHQAAKNWGGKTMRIRVWKTR